MSEIIDVLLYIREPELSILWEQSHPADEGADVPAGARILIGAIRGYWKEAPGPHEVLNVLVTQPELDAFVDANNPALGRTITNSFGPPEFVDDVRKVDNVPNEHIAVMLDHVTYDENGNETSRTAATRSNPNYGHRFLGQRVLVAE